jgi:hypothetical protein
MTEPDAPELTAETAGAGEDPGSEQDLSQGAQAEGATPEPGDGVDWEAEARKWRDLSKKNEARAKENASAAVQLKKIQDKDKSELQLAQEQLAEAQESARTSQENHWRMMAAAMNDLPVDLIDILGSGTEEEIGERAEHLANVINIRAMEIAKSSVEAMGLSWGGDGSAPTAQGAYLAGTAGRPVESMRAGAIPGQGGAPRSPEEAFRQMIAGDLG